MAGKEWNREGICLFGPLRTDDAITGTEIEGNMPVNISFVYLLALLSKSSPKVWWSFYFEPLSDNNFTGDLPYVIHESRSTQVMPQLRLTLPDQFKSVLADTYCPRINITYRLVDGKYMTLNWR